MNWFLMCPPQYFRVEYEINVHMNRANFVSPVLAMEQWNSLVELIKSLGARVDMMQPQMESPDLVFTANAGLVHEGRVALSNFLGPERRPEEPHFSRHFSWRSRLTLADRVSYEGSGDSFIHNKTLYLGVGFRSNPLSCPELMNFFHLKRSLFCHLIDPHFYHLDTAFCPLDSKTVLYYPGAFDSETQAMLLLEPWEPLLVPEEEALRFACNAVVVGKNVITPLGCPQTGILLEKAGFVHHERDMSEFLKAGGACKCLTLELTH